MAFDVVIAGGGFGGLYAARRLERRLQRHSARIRIVSDAVGLVFGRASAELGQLGHAPSLGAYLDEVAQPGEAPGATAGDA